MKKITKSATLISSLLLCTSLNAAQSGGRQILDMGCHLNNNTCYVTISGASVGPSSCNSISVRWNTQDSANGKNTLALLTSAFMSGKAVNFNIIDSCYGLYPTFNYISISR